MNRIVLASLLSEYFSRYTVAESQVEGKTILQLPRRSLPPSFLSRLRQFRSEEDVQIQIVDLRWYENRFRRRKWFTYCEVVDGCVEGLPPGEPRQGFK